MWGRKSVVILGALVICMWMWAGLSAQSPSSSSGPPKGEGKSEGAKAETEPKGLAGLEDDDWIHSTSLER